MQNILHIWPKSCYLQFKISNKSYYVNHCNFIIDENFKIVRLKELGRVNWNNIYYSNDNIFALTSIHDNGSEKFVTVFKVKSAKFEKMIIKKMQEAAEFEF